MRARSADSNWHIGDFDVIVFCAGRRGAGGAANTTVTALIQRDGYLEGVVAGIEWLIEGVMAEDRFPLVDCWFSIMMRELPCKLLFSKSMLLATVEPQQRSANFSPSSVPFTVLFDQVK